MKEEENQAPEDNHSDAENEPKLTFNPKLGLVEGKFVNCFVVVIGPYVCLL